jgi:hypothetical protein
VSAAARCSPGVSLHLLDEAGFLFDEPAQALYRLNGPATALWCLLAEGATQPDLVRFLARGGGLPGAAEAMVDGILETWRQRGLVDRARATPLVRVGPSPGSTAEPPTRFGCCRRFGPLRLAVAWDAAALTAPIEATLAHLPPATLDGAKVCLEVIQDEAGCRFVADGEILERAAAVEALSFCLRTCLIRLASRHVPHLLALHAAALARDGGCLLLPAGSGFGKTTLAAALCAAGWRYLGDDVVLLEHGTLAALPVPTPLAVKIGSVRLLGALYPELAELPGLHLQGGHVIRHLVPPTTLVVHAAQPVRWIIFPERAREGGAPTPMSASDALEALLGVCHAAPTTLTFPDVQTLVAWIQGVPCFRLPVGDGDLPTDRIASAVGSAQPTTGRASHD